MTNNFTQRHKHVDEKLIREVVDKWMVSDANMQQIESILSIPVPNKHFALRTVCQIVSSQQLYTYSECAEDVINHISHLGQRERLLTYLQPDIQGYIDKHIRDVNSLQLCANIDNKFLLSHPKEKIAYLYYLATHGCFYSKLAAGTRLSPFKDETICCFNMPDLAYQLLKSGLEECSRSDCDITKKIKRSMTSLLVEANIKIINAGLESGKSVLELIEHINWLIKNHKNHRRFAQLLSEKRELQTLLSEEQINGESTNSFLTGFDEMLN